MGVMYAFLALFALDNKCFRYRYTTEFAIVGPGCRPLPQQLAISLPSAVECAGFNLCAGVAIIMPVLTALTGRPAA